MDAEVAVKVTKLKRLFEFESYIHFFYFVFFCMFFLNIYEIMHFII